MPVLHKDVLRLVEAIVRLHEESRERFKMGSAGRQKILSRHNECIVFELAEDAYQSYRYDGVDA